MLIQEDEHCPDKGKGANNVKWSFLIAVASHTDRIMH
jgi:hypothetical protein